MSDYSTILSKMKQEIVRFTEKISGSMHRPERKFAANLCYGILASRSCLLANVADALLEQNKKVNTVERLGRHLERGVSDAAEQGYLDMVRGVIPDGEVVVHIDNSDVAKPYGKAFEGLGKVRDGSKSSGSKCVLEKGFYITEAVALSSATQPVSVFSEVWSAQSILWCWQPTARFRMCQPIVGRNKTYAIREFDYSFNSPKGRLLSTNLINGQEAEISAWRGYSYPLPTFSIASR